MLGCGHDERAVDVVQSIAKFNKTTTDLTIDDFRQIEILAREQGSVDSDDIAKTPPLTGGNVLPTPPPATRVELAQVLRNYRLLFSSRLLAQTFIVFALVYIFGA